MTNAFRQLAIFLAAWCCLAGAAVAQSVDAEAVARPDRNVGAETAGAPETADEVKSFAGDIAGRQLPVMHDIRAQAGPTLIVPEFTPVSLDDFANRANPMAQLDGDMAGREIHGVSRGNRATAASSRSSQSSEAVQEQGAASLSVAQEPNSAATIAPPPSTSDTIANLAYALKYDADLIYEYVRDTIDVRPTFGVQKGARGALLDGEGSPHDIAELMHELLLASGYQASVVLGVVDLTAEQVTQFYGLPTDNACAITTLFANAQVPHEIGTDAAAIDCNTPLLVLRMQHPYVRVRIGGADYDFDPAHKPHTLDPGMDVRAMMQFPEGELRAIAEEGSTRIASDYGVANLNRDGVREALQNYSVNLIESLRTNAPAASLKEVIGGKTIKIAEPCFKNRSTACLTRQSMLPYRNVTFGEAVYPGGFPVEQRILVRVSYPGVDQLFTSDYLYDKRLTISANELLQPELRAGGVLLARGSAIAEGRINPLRVEVLHLAYAQTFANRVYNEGILSGETLNIALGFGPESDARSALHKRNFAEGITGLQNAPDPDAARVVESVLGPQFAAMGSELMSQLSATSKIIDSAAKSTGLIHHVVGFNGHRNAAFHNIGLSYNAVSRENISNKASGAYIMAVTHGSALEGATIEQATGRPAVSTVKMIDLALERGLPTYFAASANFETEVAPNLVNCQNGLSGIRDIIRTGRIVFLPQDCTQIYERFRGIGFVTLGGGIGTYISGFYNGGYGADLYGQGDWGYPRLVRPRRTRNPEEDLDPVDLSSGHFTYSNSDLSIGEGGFPSQLAFQRTYSSGLGQVDSVLGRGWTHNLDVSVAEIEDAHQVLGKDSPLDAATTIAQVYSIVDTFSTGTVDVVDMSVSMVANAWYAERLKANNVLYKSGLGSTLFTELADGTFNPGPESAMRLTREADETYTIASPQQEITRFDAKGRASEWSNPAGVKLSFSYGTNDRLLGVSNNFGRALSLSYSPTRLLGVSDNAGRSIAYSYDLAGNLTGFTDAANALTTYEYGEPGQLVSFAMAANPDYPQVVNSYDGLGRLVSQVNADGDTYRLHIAGRRTELVSGLGRRSVDYFGERGEHLASYDDIDDGSELYEWDVKAVRKTYDGRGRLVRIASSFEPTWEYTYDDATCAAGAKVCTNNIATATRKASRLGGLNDDLPDQVMSYAYESRFARPVRITGAYGEISDFTYDQATGLLTQALAAAPGEGLARPSIAYSYTPHQGSDGSMIHLPTEMVEAIGGGEGTVTRFTYATGNHLVPLSTTTLVGSRRETATFGYDAVGNIVSLDGPRTDVSDRITLSYDAQRRLIGETDALGRQTVYGRNADGELVRTAAQDGANWLAICRELAPSGKIVAETGSAIVATPDSCPATGRRTAMAYDADGNISRATTLLPAAEGGDRVTAFEYTPSGDLMNVFNAVGSAIEQRTVGTTRAFSNDDGFQSGSFNSTRFAMPEGWLSRTFVEDGHGRTNSFTVFECATVQRVDDPCFGYADSTTSYVHDVADNVTGITLRNGSVVDQVYDALGRLIEFDAPESFNDVDYIYDLQGRMVAAAAATRKGVGVSFTYDEAGRILTETTPVGTVTYSYDPAGNLASLTWPDGFSIAYSYDALNRMTQVREGAAGGNVLADFEYDDLSRRTALAFGNGTGTTYSYDGEGRLQSLAIDLAQTAGDVAWTYDYDATGALIGQTSTNDAYDFAGFLDVQRPYRDNGIDGILESGAAVFTYDDNGNIAGDGTWVFDYDSLNRLTRASVKGGPQANYAYDTLGRLHSRHPKSAKLTVKYLYAGDQLIGEYDVNGALIRRYVPGARLDETVAIYEGINGASRTYLYTDRLGSIVAAADDAGVLLSSYTYGPFGEPNTTTGVPLRFTGRPLDPDTGLSYHRARWYSPNLGRFMSPDPIGIADGLHMYAYVANDPLNFTDPSGECAIPGAIGGALLEGGMQALNRKDRAAWGRGWDRLWQGDFSGAWGEARGQIGRVAGAGAVGGISCGIGGGVLMDRARRTGGGRLEWSHWIPARKFQKRGGPLPDRLDGPWNGSWVSNRRHYKHDPYRYGTRKGEHLDWGEKWSPGIQQLDRIPDWLKGLGFGAAAGQAAPGG